MGTNYYTKTEKCDKCSHKPEGIHLGKSPGGWQFIFQYNEGKYYKNVDEMKEWLKDKIIEDEDDEEVSYDEFWQMVKDKQIAKNLIQAETIDGYSFIDCEFS